MPPSTDTVANLGDSLRLGGVPVPIGFDLGTVIASCKKGPGISAAAAGDAPITGELVARELTPALAELRGLVHMLVPALDEGRAQTAVAAGLRSVLCKTRLAKRCTLAVDPAV
jgi:hypothetical protein